MAGQSNTDYETYYVPEQSRLAICATIGAVTLVLGFASGLNNMTFGTGSGAMSWSLFAVGMAVLVATLAGWFRVTIIENRAGMNSAQLKNSYVIGMLWFIFSEVMFFAAFFGALFYIRVLVGPWLAGEGDHGEGLTGSLLWPGFEFAWPLMTTPQQAVGIENQLIANNGTFNGAKDVIHATGLPLINTILLLTSSVTCHFAHTAMKKDKRGQFNLMLGATIILGFVFVFFQAEEYIEAYTELGLTLESGIYGSTFFMLTGFHGFHVCLGAVMLSVQWLRSMTAGHFSAEDQFGFEASSWYWHFVDVVWVALFIFVYIV